MAVSGARLLLGGFWLLLTVPAVASDDVVFSGFGTLGVSHFSEDHADFVPQRTRQSRGPGVSEDYSWLLDSIVGGQLDFSLSDDWEIAVQGVAHQQPNGDFGVDIALALVRWRILPDLQFRAGRMHASNFLDSETWLVNFANIWARPPLEVYVAMQIPYRDGAALGYSHDLAGWRADWLLGWSQTKNAETAYGYGIPVGRTDYLGPEFRLQLVKNDWTLFVSGARFRSSLDTPTFEPALVAIGALDPAMEKALRPAGQQQATWALAVRWHHGDWLAQSEYVHRHSVTGAPSLDGGYATLAFSRDRWSLYGTAAFVETRNNIDPTGSPAEPIVRRVFAVLEGDRRSLSLGYSYAVSDGVKVRFQLDHVIPQSGSNGLYLNNDAGYNQADPGSANLYTVNVDFLF